MTDKSRGPSSPLRPDSGIKDEGRMPASIFGSLTAEMTLAKGMKLPFMSENWSSGSGKHQKNSLVG